MVGSMGHVRYDSRRDGLVRRAGWRMFEPRHKIYNNKAICATSKGSDQSALTRSLIRAIASRLNTYTYLKSAIPRPKLA